MFTHPIVAIGLLPWFHHAVIPRSILMAGIILTCLPDIDVLGLKLGVPYLHLFGHRGFTHSIFFAVLFSGCVAWCLARISHSKLNIVWFYFFLCMASHGLLDALTNGGHGIAFFSPFSNERYFLPFQPVEVSTLSVRRFFNGQGSDVIISEMLWIWAPFLFVFLAGMVWHLLVKKSARGGQYGKIG